MTFQRYDERIPAAVSQLRLLLIKTRSISMDIDTGDQLATFDYSARFIVRLVDGNERIIDREISGDLLPHLTAQQIAALKSFIDDLYAKAEAEILPG